MSPHLHLAPAAPPDERGPYGAPANLIRVVLADDHEVMRSRLRRLLDDDDRIEVIADTNDLGEAVRAVSHNHPRVLVLDMTMSSGSSIDAIRHLREYAPATEIVVLKMDASAAYARHAFDAGAIAYVLKDTADSELAEAVKHAARGERFLSPRVAAQLGGELAC